MIEYVLHANEFERESDQENVVGRIAALNDVKTASQKDPPREKELPKQRTTELPHVTQRAVPLLGRGVAVNMDPLKTLVTFFVAFALWAQNRYFVFVGVQ
jgi:hypothetical protein